MTTVLDPKFWSPELWRIVPLKEGARLAGVSIDTLRRHHAHLIVHPSPGRAGIRVGDALLWRTVRRPNGSLLHRHPRLAWDADLGAIRS